MPLDLLIALGILLIGAIGFMVLGLFIQRKKANQTSLLSSGITGDEAPIPENPIYQRTKAPAAKLRTYLDVVVDAFDIITEVIKTNDIQGNVTLDAEIPRMHNGLVQVRNTAEELLAVVQQRDMGEPAEIDMGASQFALPQEPSLEVNLIVTDLTKAVGGIGPGIAGFYSSLTEADKRFVEAGAIDQIDGLIGRLERTIALMERLDTALEK